MIVYKITNLINGKLYVGQTIRSLQERWKDHCSGNSRCLAIKAAIDKYGPENFTIEQIDQASDLKDLNKKEGDWIIQMNSLSPNGYNLKTGGDQPRLCQESIDKANKTKKDRNVRPWNEGLDKTDPRVAKYIRYGKDTHAYGKVGYRKGKKLSEETKKKISEIQIGRKTSEETKVKMSNSHKKHKIKCINNDKIYNSLMDAARDLQINSGGICHVLKGNTKSIKGYVFEYVGDL
jgi:group I intron endonuclease